MIQIKIDLGNYRQAIFDLDKEENIISAKFIQGVSEMDVSKFADLFDIPYIMKRVVKHNVNKS